MKWPLERCYIIAEIGINHNGDPENVMRMIDLAADAGCDCVKFQKRSVEIVYSPEELAKPRESVFGNTNGDLKRGLELSLQTYRRIVKRLSGSGMDWMASCWDLASFFFIEALNPPCHKVASACLTDGELLAATRATGKPVFLSTGMSTLAELDRAVEILGREQLVIMHCVSTYPSNNAELNLRCIESLRKRYSVPVGYSGHERGLATTVAAVALGAVAVERHITLDRAMWGSDQAASLEPDGLRRIVRDIRAVESALGDGLKRIYDSELPIRQKLRRICV